MATFPTLTPSSRTYTPGEYPHTVYTGLSGDESRVRHSSAMASSMVRLSFYGLSESDMLSILSHYQGQYGSFQAFDVPSALWSGMTDTTPFTLTGYRWRYESSPTVADLPCGTHNVDVSLVSVPPEAVTVPGLTRSIVLSIAVLPPATANGLDKTITASIEYGSAEVSGLAATVTASLTPGAFAFSGEAQGAGFDVLATLTPGWPIIAGGANLTVAVSLTTGSIIAALNPVLWYDFDDSSTVSLSGSTITQITDKGSRGWTLTKSATGPTQATWTNNSRKCCDWGSSQHSNKLRNTSTTSTAIGEIYVVLDAAFGSTFPDYNGLITDTIDNQDDFHVTTGGPGTTRFDTSSINSFNAAYLNGSATNSITAVLPTINSPCLLRLKKTTDAAVTTTDGFQIGGDRNNGSRGWYGLIAEVVVFSSVLSSTNRTAVQNYLADKWGLTLS